MAVSLSRRFGAHAAKGGREHARRTRCQRGPPLTSNPHLATGSGRARPEEGQLRLPPSEQFTRRWPVWSNSSSPASEELYEAQGYSARVETPARLCLHYLPM